MPAYSKRSMEKLNDVDPRLQKLFMRVVQKFDNSIITGYRNKEEQESHFRAGRSELRYPHGKHNKNPSKAVDAAPYPIDWEDRERFNYFAGYVKGVADSMGIPVRWGGDWDNDTEVKDNNFDDLLHFEIIE